MIKSVLKIACGAVICVAFFVACGESKSESSGESSANIANAESNATKSVDSSVESTTTRHSEGSEATEESKKIAKDSNESQKDSPKDSPQNTAIQAKNPKDLYKKCIACHGARGDKVAPGSAGNILIKDLSKSILIADMKGYRAKTLNKGGTAAIMYLQANNLSDEDIEILGEYISNFKK